MLIGSCRHEIKDGMEETGKLEGCTRGEILDAFMPKETQEVLPMQKVSSCKHFFCSPEIQHALAPVVGRERHSRFPIQ